MHLGSFDGNQAPAIKFDYIYTASGIYDSDNCLDESLYYTKWDLHNNGLDEVSNQSLTLTGGNWEYDSEQTQCGGINKY